jgi:N-methylhydantoinase A
MRHDVVQSFYRPLAELDGSEVRAALDALEEEGAALLEREGIGADERYSARSADMRYVGQEYTVNVPLGREISLDEIDGAFHEVHRIRYGHSTPGAPVEFVNLRLAALGRIATPVGPTTTATSGEDPQLGTRHVVFAGAEHETPVLLRERLPAQSSYEGPVVIEEQSSTTLVPPGSTAMLDEHGNIVITRA